MERYVVFLKKRRGKRWDITHYLNIYFNLCCYMVCSHHHPKRTRMVRKMEYYKSCTCSYEKQKGQHRNQHVLLWWWAVIWTRQVTWWKNITHQAQMSICRSRRLSTRKNTEEIWYIIYACEEEEVFWLYTHVIGLRECNNSTTYKTHATEHQEQQTHIISCWGWTLKLILCSHNNHHCNHLPQQPSRNKSF